MFKENSPLMRFLIAVIFSVLLFTGCHQQPGEKPIIKIGDTTIFIDYPVAVVIPNNRADQALKIEKETVVEKIHASRQIAVLDSKAGTMVFVKTNGDRITLEISKLSVRYDIVLFNTVNDPLPCRLADLHDVMLQLFNNPVKETTVIEPIQERMFKQLKNANTSRQKQRVNFLSRLKNRGRRLVVSIPDTSTKIFIPRMIPDICWVVQRIDTRTILRITFENDLITYANTDRYFTNGISVELQNPRLARSPLQRFMIPYRHTAFVTYSLRLVQDMFTPTDTRDAPTLLNDRPYASYLYLGYRKTIADPARKLRISSQLDLGYLGQYSPGSYLQTLVHKTFPTNDIPQGWETQIKTDLILNYDFQVQRAIVRMNKLILLATASAKGGTLSDKAGVGFQFQAGKAEPLFGLDENKKWPNLEYYFFVKADAGLVAYNALLQGGMLNRENVFTLKSNEISRFVGSAETGIHFRYKGTGIELAQHFLTPEYKGGYWHKWGRIMLLFKL